MNGRYEVRFGGTGGQGLILSARILALAVGGGERHVAQSQSYEPTSRGGFCHADLVVARGPVDYPLATSLDYAVLLDQLAVAPTVPLIREGALVLADDRHVAAPPDGAWTLRVLPLSRTALELGAERITNIVALAALARLAGLCEFDALERAVRSETPRGFMGPNLAAIAAGWEMPEQGG